MGALKLLLVLLLCIPIAYLGYTLFSGLMNEVLNLRQRDREARKVARKRR